MRVGCRLACEYFFGEYTNIHRRNTSGRVRKRFKIFCSSVKCFSACIVFLLEKRDHDRRWAEGIRLRCFETHVLLGLLVLGVLSHSDAL